MSTTQTWKSALKLKRPAKARVEVIDFLGIDGFFVVDVMKTVQSIGDGEERKCPFFEYPRFSWWKVNTSVHIKPQHICLVQDVHDVAIFLDVLEFIGTGCNDNSLS